jgi:hypothetical protein
MVVYLPLPYFAISTFLLRVIRTAENIHDKEKIYQSEVDRHEYKVHRSYVSISRIRKFAQISQ